MRVKPTNMSLLTLYLVFDIMMVYLTPHGFPDMLPHQLALVQGLGNSLEACYVDFKIFFTVMHLIETGCPNIQNI